MPDFNKVFSALMILLFIAAGLSAQENDNDVSDDAPAVTADAGDSGADENNSTDDADSTDGSAEPVEGETAEAGTEPVAGEDSAAQEVEEDSGSSVTANFNIGSFPMYDRSRAKYFYEDIFGWYPQILMDLAVDVLPRAINNMGFDFTGLAINGNPTKVQFKWGGGIETKSYSGGADGRDYRYTENQDFWGEQGSLKDRGMSYVDSTYDTGYLFWLVQWDQDIVLPDPKHNMHFHLGYKGLYRKWFTDLGPYSTNVEYYLDDTDYPDKDQYLLNKLYTGISFGKTEYPDVPFSHGLKTSIGTSFNFEIAPWFLNFHLSDLALGMNSEGELDFVNKSNWIKLKDFFGRQVTDYYGSIIEIPRKTADYYQVNWSVSGQRGMWDVAPERKSNWFSGYIDWGAGVRWFDEIGDAGYIPLEVRGNFTRRFAVWGDVSLKMNLPTITVADLKGWSTPEANANFEKVEESFANLLGFFGVQVDKQSWGNVPFLQSWLNTRFHAGYDSEVDPWSERTYELYYDERNAFDTYIKMEFRVRVMDFIEFGFNATFDVDNRNGWADPHFGF
jgi:hypothetical protein